MNEMPVETVLREFLEAQDAGRCPDTAAYIARYPELSEYFDAAERVEETIRWYAPNTPPESLPTVPGYEVKGVLGRGGMGVVYKAVQPVLGRTVALKLLKADEDSVANRMTAEARAAARLDHPGIVPIFEVGEIAGRPYLAMAYVPGGTLAARVARGPVPSKEAARIVRSVAIAVQHAHEQGIIHRDLKPANILVGPDGQPKVTDFGLAKRSGEETISAAGDVLGTPAYMPPEFAAGEAQAAGPAADVYGIGAVLYALLTGRPPFTGDTPLDTIRQVAQDDPVPPRERNPRVDRGIQSVCLKCLEKNPRHRYPSAAALVADLDRYLRDEPPKAEQLGWGDWARRQLDRAVDFGHAGRWARLLHYLAAATILTHAALYFGTRGVADGWAFWLAFLGAMTATTWGPCVWAAAYRRLDSKEREILLFWLGVSLGQVILFADRCPVGGVTTAAEVGRCFSAFLVLYGVMFFAGGRLYWGRLYLLGLANFGVALGLLAVPDVAPPLYGVWLAGVYFAIARHLRRVARDWAARAPSIAPAGI